MVNVTMKIKIITVKFSLVILHTVTCKGFYIVIAITSPITLQTAIQALIDERIIYVHSDQISHDNEYNIYVVKHGHIVYSAA